MNYKKDFVMPHSSTRSPTTWAPYEVTLNNFNM